MAKVRYTMTVVSYADVTPGKGGWSHLSEDATLQDYIDDDIENIDDDLGLFIENAEDIKITGEVVSD